MQKRKAEKERTKFAIAAITPDSITNNISGSLSGIQNPAFEAIEETPVQSEPKAGDEIRDRLLHEIKKDNLEMVKEIVKEFRSKGITGTEDFMLTSHRMNALHFAAHNGSSASARHLIRHGHPSLQTQDFEVVVKGNVASRNILHLLTLKNNVDLARQVLEQTTDRDAKERLMLQETAMEIVGQRPRTFTPFHIAAFQGFVELVKLYLQHGMSVNHLNSKNDTALLWASRWGHVDVIRTLIANGAMANIENDKGSTALYWATRYNHPEAVKLLATEGKANVNQVRKVGLVAPIILASALGYATIVRILLENGADANMEIRGGETPLMQAAREGHITVARVLLDFKACVDKQDERGDTPLTLAAKFGNANIVELLLHRGAKVTHKNHEGHGAWHYAINNEENDILVTLVRFLAEKSSPSSLANRLTKKPPLCIGASLGASEKLKFLISLGLDPTESDPAGNTMLHHAAINDHDEVIKSFHQQVGIDRQNKAGDTPLHIACSHGHSECISVLLECKAKANIKNSRGDTALHVMARSVNTQPSSVAMLMDYMIKTHAWDSLHEQDANGNSALHEAAAHASCEVLWEFRGLSFKQKNSDGNTPLHSAVRPNHPEVLDTMLDIFETMTRDADINERNNNRETVLHLAALQGFASSTKHLIRFGADLSAQDKNGNTVFHLLTIATAKDADNAKQYLDVMDVLFEELVRWWCLCKEIVYPDDDKYMYRHIKRKAVHHLTAAIFNENGLSVLTLASKLGAKHVLNKILMMPYVNFISKNGTARMDITHLTPQTSTPATSGRGSSKISPSVSCMEWLVSMEDPHKAGQTFDIPTLRQVEKIYGGICAWTYSMLMILHLLYMSAFSAIAITLLSEQRNNGSGLYSIQIATYAVVPIEPSVILLYILYLLFRYTLTSDFSRRSQLLKGQRGFVAFQTMVSSYLPIVTGVCYAILVIIWVILYHVQFLFHDYVLAVSLLVGWLFSIAFTRGFKAVHYFWKMLQLMIVRDVFRFIFVYVFILLAFSFAFHVLFQVSDGVASLYPNALDTIFTTFNTMIGMDWLFEGDVQAGLAAAGRSSVPLKVFHILYVILTTIILLNLLIAMMNDSYQNIRVNQTVTWRVDSVRLGLEIETMLPWSSSLFSSIRIKKGDILQPGDGDAGRASPGSDDSGDTDDAQAPAQDRWYVEIPLANITVDGSTNEDDISHQIAAISRRLETLETKLTDTLQIVHQSVRELQIKVSGEQTDL